VGKQVQEAAGRGIRDRSPSDPGILGTVRGSRAGARLSAVWAVTAACLLTLSACGDDSGSSEPSRSYRLELAAGAPSRSSGATVLATGPLAPGRYVTPNFSPRLTFTVGNGWVLDAESSSQLQLYRGSDPDAAFLGIAVLDDLAVPENPFPSFEGESLYDPSAALRRYETRPAPHDFIGYLDQLDHIEVGPRAPLTIGGWAGQQADGRTEDLSGLPGVCGGAPGPCFILVIALEPVPLLYADHAPGRFRSAVLDGPGGPLVVHMSAPDDEAFAELIVAADAVLASMEIGVRE
jgi:hypothetical protein